MVKNAGVVGYAEINLYHCELLFDFLLPFSKNYGKLYTEHTFEVALWKYYQKAYHYRKN